MKIACSSASFAQPLEAGELTQLEWLDACANELEVDGVVFEAAHFPREDGEYLAQLKKLATDLGLTVAALAAEAVLGADCERYLALAGALGAPLAIARTPRAVEDPSAWGNFVDGVKHATRAAKRTNVTLAVLSARGTLCADATDLGRLAKDVDSAWLRFGFDSSALGVTDDATPILEKAVIATHHIANLARFATAADSEAAHLNASLARFRGFIVLEGAADPGIATFHDAIERFAHYRARSLTAPH